MPQWLVIALLPVVGAVLTVVVQKLFDLRATKVTEQGQIHAALWEQIKSLKDEARALAEALAGFRKGYEDSRALITDFEIALSRTVARLEELAEWITALLEAEEELEAGHVRKARVLLKLVERDRAMREEMRLSERFKTERIG